MEETDENTKRLRGETTNKCKNGKKRCVQKRWKYKNSTHFALKEKRIMIQRYFDAKKQKAVKQNEVLKYSETQKKCR